MKAPMPFTREDIPKRITRSRSIATTALVLLLLFPFRSIAATGGQVSEFRADLDKWVEAREVLSKERSDWLVDKEYLLATRKLLAEEKEALQAEILEFKASDQGASEERRALLVERAEYQRANASLKEQLAALEERLLDIVPRLPRPLQKRLEPLLTQVPADSDRAAGIPIGSRLINVLGVLAQTDKFNSSATLVGETRGVGSGRKVQVRTLYWGLAEAVYVDGQGRTAGVARPGPKGWEFDDEPTLAPEAGRLLDIYEGNVDTISFVPIPVTIQ